jgi:hypothetical protein
MLVALKNGEAKIAIDGNKFLELLGMTEEDCTKEGADEKIAFKLLCMTDDERKQIFSESLLKDIRDIKKEESTYKITSKNHLKNEKTLKKEIRYCKNYTKKKELEKQLNELYKEKKHGCYC